MTQDMDGRNIGIEKNTVAADDETPADMAVVRKLRNENKKLRRELREAQEDLGGASARLAAAERRVIEAAAPQGDGRAARHRHLQLRLEIHRRGMADPTMTDKPIFDMDGHVVSVERVGDRIILSRFDDDGPTTIGNLNREQALQLACDMLTHPAVRGRHDDT